MCLPSGFNLFDAYDDEFPHLLESVSSRDEAISYVVRLLDYGGILCNLFYNPKLHDPDMYEASPREGDALQEQENCDVGVEKDDLRRYAEEVLVRYLLGVGYDLCEAEGDPIAWRGLRRAMVLYFLASNLTNQGQKYPSSTLVDLIVEESSSERTRARFDNMVSVNLSGRNGDGLWQAGVNKKPFTILEIPSFDRQKLGWHTIMEQADCPYSYRV